ncbi:unnamed protein product [Victoria cruziana]
MAAFSPRSLSPGPERSMSGFRITDSRSVTRRSQNASSGIKTNSSSDFHQRSSVSRERSVSPSPRVSFEHKEDDRDENQHCPKLVRSGPLPSFSKGTKNFMAPTISAASKITASPRKKVLSERNAIDHNAYPYSTSSPQMPEAETFSRYTIEGPRNMVNAKKCSEPEEPKNPKILAPASPNDASQPPYDPHLNFLSPRPEFLRYSPNPRLERYRREENCTKAAIRKQLESSFASESSLTAEELQEYCGSEIGVTSGLEGDDISEETHSAESGFTTGLEPNGDNEEKSPSQIEASSELESPRRSLLSHEEKPGMDNEKGTEFSSPESGTKNMAQEDVAEFAASKTSCSKFFLKPKLINVALVIAIASLCLPMIDSPQLFSSLMYHGNVSRSCLVSLVEQNVYQDILSITDIAARNWCPEIKQVGNIKAEPVQTEDVSVRASIPDDQMSASNVADSVFSVDSTQPEVIMAILKEEPVSKLEFDGEMEHSKEVPLPQQELIPVVESAEPAADVENGLPEATITLDPLTKSATPHSSSEKSEMQAPFAEDIDPTTLPTLPEEEAIEEPSASIYQVENLTSLGKALGIQVALGVLLAALTIVALTYWKTNNNRLKKMEYLKMKADNVQVSIGQHAVSVVEMTGESSSAEMSSTTSEKTMHYPGRVEKETEEVVQNCERSRRSRRGSSVPSSEDSLSYGSYTIYEKLPTKQGSADEGTVTPVRRSSRIKKQVISS